jgi:hypothetical protein
MSTVTPSSTAPDARDDSDARIAAAIAGAYAAAPRLHGGPGGTSSAIAPLFRLTEGYELVVHEVADLSRRTASRHLEARAGRPLIADAGEDAPLAGLLYANARGGWILVRQGDRLTRRRFSVAHELGHYLLHFLPRLEQWAAPTGTAGTADEDDEEPEFEEALPPAADEEEVGGGHVVAASGPQAQADLEREADRFAAELLMPAGVCRVLVDRFGPTCGHKPAVLARRLAGEFLVSRQAMERRLAELGLA